MRFYPFVGFLALQIVSTIGLLDVEQAFIDFEVVPDVIDKAPIDLAHVVFPSGAEAELGNRVSLNDTQEEPTILWNDYDESSYYTIVMVDPDAPSRAAPAGRSHLHWLVTNARSSGDELATYLHPAPSPATGLHRYTFLVFLQPGWLEFDEKPILETTGDSGLYRKNFDVSVFAQNYGLGEAIAGNFILAENGY